MADRYRLSRDCDGFCMCESCQAAIREVYKQVDRLITALESLWGVEIRPPKPRHLSAVEPRQ